MREKSNFAFPFKLIWVVQCLGQKFFYFFISEMEDYCGCPGPKEGTYRERHIRWADDAVDVMVPIDERR